MTDYLYCDISKQQEEHYASLLLELEIRTGRKRNPHSSRTLNAYLSVCFGHFADAFRKHGAGPDEKILSAKISKEQTGFVRDLVEELCLLIHKNADEFVGKPLLHVLKLCYPADALKKRKPRYEERRSFDKNLAQKRRANEQDSYRASHARLLKKD